MIAGVYDTNLNHGRDIFQSLTLANGINVPVVLENGRPLADDAQVNVEDPRCGMYSTDPSAEVYFSGVCAPAR